MSEIVPGVSTREDARRLLGNPFYSSTAWDADLYSDTTVALTDTGKRSTPATLLVVYGPGDVVSGTAYQGDGCPNDCRVGDTKGLDIERLQVLLAPREKTGRLLEEGGAVDLCTVLVDATDIFINSYGGYGLYMDEHFLQHVAGKGFFRIEVSPQKHLLSCLSVWEQYSRRKLSEPGHAIVQEKRGKSFFNLNEELAFECSSGEVQYFSLVHAAVLGIFQPTGCGIEPTDEAGFLARVQNSRLIIIPDAPSSFP